MSRLLEEILLYNNCKDKYSKEDSIKIKAELVKECNKKIRKTFLKTIRCINDI